MTDKACIKVVMHGATVFQDYRDWAETTIQDWEAAHSISEGMLNGEVFEDNVMEPEFYATYEAVDIAELVRQRNAVSSTIA